MRVRTFLLLCGGLVTTVSSPVPLSAQALSRPDGWRTQAERFVAMPPGFHFTTTSSVLFYHPEATAAGEFDVESEGFLFRGESAHAYGLFIGGRNLERDDATWTSLEVAHDGTWVVRERRSGGENAGHVVADLVGPEPGPVAVPGEETTAKNVLAVSVGEENVVFRLNGETVATLPRADLAVEGVVGFRVGADLNLHLTTLTITSGGETKAWAPTPAEPAADSEGGGV